MAEARLDATLSLKDAQFVRGLKSAEMKAKAFGASASRSIGSAKSSMTGLANEAERAARATQRLTTAQAASIRGARGATIGARGVGRGAAGGMLLGGMLGDFTGELKSVFKQKATGALIGDAVAEMIEGGIGGALVGGPIGAVIGAGIGGVKSSIKAGEESKKAMADAQEETTQYFADKEQRKKAEAAKRDAAKEKAAAKAEKDIEQATAMRDAFIKATPGRVGKISGKTSAERALETAALAGRFSKIEADAAGLSPEAKAEFLARKRAGRVTDEEKRDAMKAVRESAWTSTFNDNGARSSLTGGTGKTSEEEWRAKFRGGGGTLPLTAKNTDDKTGEAKVDDASIDKLAAKIKAAVDELVLKP